MKDDKDKKEKIALFRLTKEDWEVFKEIAEKNNQSPSEVLRNFVIRYNKKENKQ